MPRTLGKVISITPTVRMTITAMVSRRSITTWVRTRRACRLSGTSTRNRASAVSSTTTSSAATSQASGGDDAEDEHVQQQPPPASPTAYPVVKRTANCTARTVAATWNGRCAWSVSSVSSSDRRPNRRVNRWTTSTRNRATAAATSAATAVSR